MSLRVISLPLVFVLVSGWVLAQSAQPTHPAGPEEVVRQYCDFDVKIGRISTDNFQKLPPLYTWEEEPGWDGVTLVSGFKITSTKITEGHAVVTVVWQVVGEFGGEKVKEPRTKEETVEYQLRLVGGVWKIDAPILCPHVAPSTMRAFVLKNYPDDASRREVIRQLDAVSEKKI